jgi:hypothetical protein
MDGSREIHQRPEGRVAPADTVGATVSIYRINEVKHSLNAADYVAPYDDSEHENAVAFMNSLLNVVDDDEDHELGIFWIWSGNS